MLSLILSLFMSTAFAGSTYSCQTTYDHLHIPHTNTSSTEEYYFCFGLHHGQDRAWEMDYFRRVGEGTNAEVLGFSQLKSDLMMRLLDLPAVAEKLWRDFPEEQKKWLKLYAEGVNKGFETGKKSQEFMDLNVIPEPWKPQHTLLVLLLQSFDQTRKTFSRDYEDEKLKIKWGEKFTQLFEEDNAPWENTILKRGEYPKREAVVKTTSYKYSDFSLWGDFPYVFGKESGSNNWVVSKEKSKTGNALLANDPHLDLKTPMFWYWISLSTPDYAVIGGSVPGVPVIANGTNGKVSWGLTNSYINSADAVFVKNIRPDQIESLRPLVKIKFWFLKLPFFFKSFEQLKSGHKILPLEIESDEKLVLRWSGFSLRPEDIVPMFDFYKVSNVSEMDQMISKVGVPSWNFVFADTKGDIGYRLVGKTFRHTEKLPRGISSMNFEEFNKEEYLLPDERPHILNPERHYVYSANNRHWPTDAQFYGGSSYSQSYRGHRIDEMLQGPQDVENFKKIQCDRKVVDASFFLDKIQKHLNIPEFKNWSMVADDSSKVLPIYRRLMDITMEKWEVNEPALFRLLDQLSKSQVVALKSFYDQALAEVDGRTWGEMHRVNFSHMSKNASWLFSPDIPGIGDTHSVDPGTAIWNAEKKIYEQYSGASMRLIVEMGEIPRIWLALPGLNRHYDKKPNHSPWENWKNCQYSEIKF